MLRVFDTKKIDRLWVFAILFINGWNFALPVTDKVMPIWFTPVQLIYGIFTHELLLLAYLGFLVITRNGNLPIRQHGARNIAFLIAGLGCLGILSNGINFQPLKEMGEAGRLFLLAAYFLLSIHWAKKHGPTFVLRTLLLGIAGAGAINLYYSFTVRSMELGGLPFLLGQNGPGGYLGLSVVLGAWLMLERKAPLDATIAGVSCVIGLLTVSISYSKSSMLIAGFGLIAWGIVIWPAFIERRSRRLSAVMLALLIAIALVNQERIGRYVQGVSTFIHYMFLANPIIEHRSVESRSQYFIITAEIMSRHPIFGVGYGGFYDAATATEGYENQLSVPEDPEAGRRGESNPHNSFLYYASANGLPGLIVTVLLFMMTIRALWRTLSVRGVKGKVLWICLAGSYFIFSMTMPTIFNTSIFYIPGAFAISLRNHTLLRLSKIRVGAIPILT